jgi:hypothetical protein
MIWTSLFGIVTIIMLARALGFAKVPLLVDAEEARRIAADALHDFKARDAAISRDRRGALVAGDDGRIALIRGFGDRWVVRIVNGARTVVSGDRLRLEPAEAMFPAADLDLGPAAADWARRV